MVSLRDAYLANLDALLCLVPSQKLAVVASKSNIRLKTRVWTQLKIIFNFKNIFDIRNIVEKKLLEGELAVVGEEVEEVDPAVDGGTHHGVQLGPLEVGPHDLIQLAVTQNLILGIGQILSRILLVHSNKFVGRHQE